MSETPAAPNLASRFHLRTLGSLALIDSSGATILGAHGHHKRRLALLSAVAAAGDRGRSRDQLLLLFWPEVTQGRARHSLDQLVYALRNSLSEEVFAGINPLRINERVVGSDIGAFISAHDRQDYTTAVAAYGGSFLDGFYLGDSSEFEQWVDTERARFAAKYTDALERLARAASEAGDDVAAVRWWRALTESEPLSSQYAAGYMRALIRARDGAAALRHAERHASLLAQDLGVEPGSEVTTLIAELRAKPQPSAMAREAPLTRPALGNAAGDLPQPRADSPPKPPNRNASRHWVRYPAGLIIVALSLVGARSSLRWRSVVTGPGADASVAAPSEPAKTKRASTANVAAYELYLKGNDPTLLRSDSAVRLGVDYLDRAIALDPTFAAAYAARSRLTFRLAFSDDTTMTRHDRIAAANHFAVTALALDDTSADAHATAGLFHRRRFNFRSAETELKRAIMLEPTTALFHEWLTQQYVMTERSVEALAEARRAVELAPLSATANAELARALLANDRVDEALQVVAALRSLNPPLLRAGSIAAECYARKGMWGEAIAELQPSFANTGPRGRALYAYLLARAGRTKEAQGILAALLTRSKYGGDPGAIATVYVGLGEKDQALDWLARASIDGTPLDNLPMLLRDLAPDPRVQSIRRQLGIQ